MNTNLPRDHWEMLLPVSLHESFIRLMGFAKPYSYRNENPLGQDSYRMINDLREASTALGKRRSFVGLTFVIHYPFLVCANRQSGAGWREPYYLFERLTDSYRFRLPEGWLVEQTDRVEFSNESASDRVLKLIADFPAARACIEFEASYLWKCLQLCCGNKAAACRLSGMGRLTLYRKIAAYQKLGIWPGEKYIRSFAARPFQAFGGFFMGLTRLWR